MKNLYKKPFAHYILFGLILCIVAVAAVSYYFIVRERVKKEVSDNLSILADVKKSEVIRWCEERASDSRFIQQSSEFKKLIFKFLSSQDENIKSQIINWIKPIKENHEYSNILLISNSGKIFSLFQQNDSLVVNDNKALKKAFTKNNIHLGKINKQKNEISLGYFIPLTLPGINNENPFAVIKIKIDPSINLYPIIAKVSDKSKTAETFLVRRDGDSVSFINNLRHKNNSALTFKLPLSLKKLPAAMAVKGKTGNYEGIDYAGNKVLAHLDKIKGTPWFIVSKINLDEVYAPVFEYSIYIAITASALILVFGLIIYSAWKNQKIGYLNKQIEIQNEKLAAEEKIRKLSAAVEQSPVTIVITDNEGRIEYANPRFTELTGYTLEEAYGNNPRILKSGQTPQNTYKEMWETIRSGKQWTGEFINKKKNGEIFWEFASIAPIINEEGIATHYVAVKEDITAAKIAEKELKKSKEQISNIIETAMDGVITIDENQKIIVFNKASEKIFDIKADDAIGQPIEKFIPDRFHDAHSKKVETFGNVPNQPRFMGTNGIISAIHGSGEERLMEASISHFEVDGRKFYTVIHRDITEKIKTEEALKRSEEKFAKIFMDSPVGMGLIDAESFKVIDVNTVFQRLYGFTRDEAIGKTTLELKLYEDINKRALIIAMIKRGEMLRDFELNTRQRNGRIRTVLLNTELIDVGSKSTLLVVAQDITERKRIEEALIQSEKELRSFFEAGLVGIIYWHAYGKIINANNKFLEMVGYSREDLEAGVIDWMNMTPPEFRHLDEESMKELKSTGINAKPFEKEYIRKDGTHIPVLIAGAMLDEEKKNGVAFVLDITEQKKAEQELRNREQQFRTLAENAPEVIARFDRQLRHTYINQYGSIVYGIPQEEVIGKTNADLHMPANNVEFWNMHFEKVIETGKQQAIEFDFESPNLGHQYFSSLFVPEFNDSGEIRSILAITRDVTEQKRAELAIQESEQRFRQLADAMPQIVWTANPDGTVDYYNQRAFEMEGIIQQDDGKWSGELSLHPDDQLSTVNAWTDAVKSGNIYELTHRIKHKNGNYRWLLSRGIPIKNSNGEIVKWFGTSTDISFQKAIEQQLKGTLLELERSNKDLEQFAYIASHDLQEPLRMVKLYGGLIQSKFPQNITIELNQYFNFISEGTSRMQQLINDLLKYSRVSTKKHEIEEVDCNEIINSVLMDLQFLIKEQNAEIASSQLPIVKADRTQLRQLFQNFIQNAIKFRSERKPEIFINSELRDGVWLFSITDNGIGMNPAYMDRIFVIFQRLHEREKYPGTGIGLAVCKKIVERHGGEVCVESIPGKGSTFYFTLPV